MSEKQEIFTLMGGKVKMQRGIYNPTSDAVWLAAVVPSGLKTLLDVGVGTGGVALCVSAHYPNMQIYGIDISSDMLAACAENIKLNDFDIEIAQNDIFTWKTDKTFDVVVSNPPYFKGSPAKHNAHHNVDLAEWTKKCVARVKPRGYFCTIVDTRALADVVSVMNMHCGNIEIVPLFGAKNVAERVILRGRLGVRGGTILYSGVSMNNGAILRDGLTISDILATLGASC